MRPSAAAADAIHDQVADQLVEPEFRPRALFERFGISVMATTDDPCDDLSVHAALAADPGFPGRVLPTFRPDRYLGAGAPGWAQAVVRLGEVAGTGTQTYRGWVGAMEARRPPFGAHGAVSADRSHEDVGTQPLERGEAERICSAALAAFGPDTEHDTPLPTEFTDAPDAVRRFRAAVTETAGFAKTSGFIDDTRAFCSIPARHDMSRRLDAGYLARLVVEHRPEEDEALETAVDLVTALPRAVFRL